MPSSAIGRMADQSGFQPYKDPSLARLMLRGVELSPNIYRWTEPTQPAPGWDIRIVAETVLPSQPQVKRGPIESSHSSQAHGQPILCP